MKHISGNIWYQTSQGRMEIGFTKECLDEKLTECFHILPADNYAVKQRGPLMVLETNDGLEAVHSPIAGRVLFFSDKARNFPDRLTEEDVVVAIEMPREVKKIAPKKSAAPKGTPATGGRLNWDIDPFDEPMPWDRV